ncbi:MAG: hypothetical protein ACTSXU_16905 [Promethearchaeota archaeon]
MISGKQLNLEHEIVSELVSNGFTPIFINKWPDSKNSNEVSEIIFDIEPGLEYSFVRNSREEQSNLFNTLVKKLKKVKNGSLSLMTEDSVRSYSGIRIFNDASGIALTAILKQGVRYSGSLIDVESGNLQVDGEIILRLENKTNKQLILKQLETLSIGFSIDNYQDQTVLELKGELLQEPIEITLDPSRVHEDVVEFSLEIPAGIYKLTPITSSFSSSFDDNGEKYWIFPSFQVFMKEK